MPGNLATPQKPLMGHGEDASQQHSASVRADFAFEPPARAASSLTTSAGLSGALGVGRGDQSFYSTGPLPQRVAQAVYATNPLSGLRAGSCTSALRTFTRPQSIQDSQDSDAGSCAFEPAAPRLGASHLLFPVRTGVLHTWLLFGQVLLLLTACILLAPSLPQLRMQSQAQGQASLAAFILVAVTLGFTALFQALWWPAHQRWLGHLEAELAHQQQRHQRRHTHRQRYSAWCSPDGSGQVHGAAATAAQQAPPPAYPPHPHHPMLPAHRPASRLGRPHPPAFSSMGSGEGAGGQGQQPPYHTAVLQLAPGADGPGCRVDSHASMEPGLAMVTPASSVTWRSDSRHHSYVNMEHLQQQQQQQQWREGGHSHHQGQQQETALRKQQVHQAQGQRQAWSDQDQVRHPDQHPSHRFQLDPGPLPPQQQCEMGRLRSRPMPAYSPPCFHPGGAHSPQHHLASAPQPNQPDSPGKGGSTTSTQGTRKVKRSLYAPPLTDHQPGQQLPTPFAPRPPDSLRDDAAASGHIDQTRLPGHRSGAQPVGLHQAWPRPGGPGGRNSFSGTCAPGVAVAKSSASSSSHRPPQPMPPARTGRSPSEPRAAVASNKDWAASFRCASTGADSPGLTHGPHNGPGTAGYDAGAPWLCTSSESLRSFRSLGLTDPSPAPRPPSTDPFPPTQISALSRAGLRVPPDLLAERESGGGVPKALAASPLPPLAPSAVLLRTRPALLAPGTAQAGLTTGAATAGLPGLPALPPAAAAAAGLPGLPALPPAAAAAAAAAVAVKGAVGVEINTGVGSGVGDKTMCEGPTGSSGAQQQQQQQQFSPMVATPDHQHPQAALGGLKPNDQARPPAGTRTATWV